MVGGHAADPLLTRARIAWSDCGREKVRTGRRVRAESTSPTRNAEGRAWPAQWAMVESDGDSVHAGGLSSTATRKGGTRAGGNRASESHGGRSSRLTARPRAGGSQCLSAAGVAVGVAVAVLVTRGRQALGACLRDCHACRSLVMMLSRLQTSPSGADARTLRASCARSATRSLAS
jgi:hypothetical protein